MFVVSKSGPTSKVAVTKQARSPCLVVRAARRGVAVRITDLRINRLLQRSYLAGEVLASPAPQLRTLGKARSVPRLNAPLATTALNVGSRRSALETILALDDALDALLPRRQRGGYLLWGRLFQLPLSHPFSDAKVVKEDRQHSEKRAVDFLL